MQGFEQLGEYFALGLLVLVSTAVVDYAAARYFRAMESQARHRAARWSVAHGIVSSIGFIVAVKVTLWLLPFEWCGLYLGCWLGSGQGKARTTVEYNHEDSFRPCDPDRLPDLPQGSGSSAGYRAADQKQRSGGVETSVSDQGSMPGFSEPPRAQGTPVSDRLVMQRSTADCNEELEPGEYRQCDGEVWGIWRCPKCHALSSISKEVHTVDAIGDIWPASSCPHEGCGWQAWASLADWRPEPVGKA